MRRTLVMLLLCLAACASRDGMVDSVTHDCSAGGDLSVDAYLNMPKIMLEGTHDDLKMIVAVANNSNHDIEVKSIRVEPGFSAQERYSLETSFREFDKVLAPGEDEEFELPIRGVAGRRERERRFGNDAIEVVLSVYLAGGDMYRCSYDIQPPR